ncbi:MAG: hypothetical protein ABR502_10605 [Chitinophagaceae bacterium]
MPKDKNLIRQIKMMINYHNKTFKSVNNTVTGEVSSETVFKYQQTGNIVTAMYNGGTIVSGHLIAIADEEGNLDMRYHHVNNKGMLMTGFCKSVPETLPNGKLRLHEHWKWTSGDKSEGRSVVEEL